MYFVVARKPLGHNLLQEMRAANGAEMLLPVARAFLSFPLRTDRAQPRRAGIPYRPFLTADIQIFCFYLVSLQDIIAMSAFGSGALRKAVKEGDRNGSYMAGECAGMVKRIEPTKAIVEDLILGAEKVIRETAAKIA